MSQATHLIAQVCPHGTPEGDTGLEPRPSRQTMGIFCGARTSVLVLSQRRRLTVAQSHEPGTQASQGDFWGVLQPQC
ncbi:MAG: hypothetical protein ACFFBD_02295 [Candidatus Hodarchaeota archaeon]